MRRSSISALTATPLIIIAATSLLSAPVVVAQEPCVANAGTGTDSLIAGNHYCSEVKAITYNKFPGHGSYNKVTKMDAATEQCESEPFSYSGSLSPLNEELSLHLRGPLWFKQMAFYTQSSNTKIKPRAGNVQRDGHGRAGHGKRKSLNHQRLHHKLRNLKDLLQVDDKVQARAVGDMVTAVIDGKVQTWINEYAGPGVPAPTPQAEGHAVGGTKSPPTDAEEKAVVPSPPAEAPEPPIKQNKEASSTKPTPETICGDWARQAYYNADAGHAEGLTFLNHFAGPDTSGTAEGGIELGASLAYSSPNGQAGSKDAQTLGNQLLIDNIEVAILTDQSCDDGGCGYTRPGGVAYHGFGGSQKVFLFEFTMPLTGKTSFNGDMPAIWFLNAQIPLTSEYGSNSGCSCWKSNCGEFDVFEVLDPGNFRCKSTLHMSPAGGSSDWFKRPTEGAITVAVVFSGDDDKAVIRVLDGQIDFGEVLDQKTVQEWIQGPSTVFRLGE